MSVPNPIASNSNPADFCRAVTPSDDTDLTHGICRSLYVAGTGDVTIHDMTGTAVTFTGVPAGSVLPVRARRVLDTGTDATGIVALY